MGIILYLTLSWNNQINKIVKSASFKLSRLRRIRHILKPATLQLVYKSTIQPILDYACTVWSCATQGLLDKVQRCQNLAARIITNNFEYIDSRGEDIVRQLGWQTISDRCNYFSAVLIFKCLNDLVPPYMCDSINEVRFAHDRITRLSLSKNLLIPCSNTEMGKKTFTYRGSLLWNDLPESLKNCDSLNSFKRLYKSLFVPQPHIVLKLA